MDVGLEERESSGEGELSTVRANELVRKREREQDLNAMGPPKTVDPGSTGQTGCSDRSDRSGPN